LGGFFNNLRGSGARVKTISAVFNRQFGLRLRCPFYPGFWRPGGFRFRFQCVFHLWFRFGFRFRFQFQFWFQFWFLFRFGFWFWFGFWFRFRF
jgi:hypothetical protein